MTDFTNSLQIDEKVNTQLLETDGPSVLTVGDIADAQVVKRVGTELVGVTGASGSFTAGTTEVTVIDGIITAIVTP